MDIMTKVLLAVGLADPQTMSGRWIESPNPSSNIFFRDEGKRGRMLAFLIDQEDAVKNLNGLMRVHCRTDLGNHIEVSVNEFGQPPIIIHSSRSGAAPHIQLESRNTKRILDVYWNQADPESIIG